MLPAHKGELPEDTEGKDPAVQSVGARCSAQGLAAGVSAGRKTRGGKAFPTRHDLPSCKQRCLT